MGILLVLSIIWNYMFGVVMLNRTSKAKKIILGIGVGGNLGILVYFKYLKFFILKLGLVDVIPVSVYSDILLPIGISFFTFQGMSYIIDVYRKPIQTEKNIIKLGLYIAFFPQLIAGPILKFNEFSSYLSSRKSDEDKLISGSFKFIRGLAKKVLLANNFSILADSIFQSDYANLPMPIAWLGITVYTLQIYFDFSGYSDMAIGIGRMLGFEIPENFKHPYSSTSIKQFWTKWHISLSTWFKEYLYIPLGGNRKGANRTYANLIIIFFVTGLWHGANSNFIIWGMIHGAFLILERRFPSLLEKLPRVLKHFYTLLVVMLSWVFFRTTYFNEAQDFLSALFSFKLEGSYLSLLEMNPYLLTLLVIGCILVFPVRNEIVKVLQKKETERSLLLSDITKHLFYLVLLGYCILELSIATHTPFIYFKF